MTVLSVGLITGFMIGIEFPGQENPNIILVLDLGIVRLVLEKIEITEEEAE